MADDQIRYDVLAQEAMRGLVKKVLTEVARAGLPGEHHFYITFSTQAPGVRVSSRLRERYPEEMTIVVQHQYWDLEVNAQSFEIGLAFSGVPERLLVPFAAIKSFVDPSVQFGLQFDLMEEQMIPHEEGADTAAPAAIIAAPRIAEEAASTETAVDEVLSALNEGEKSKENRKNNDKKKTKEEEGVSADVVSLDAFRKKAE